jgi:asparagine synthase (glutamine-hydrolysing)
MCGFAGIFNVREQTPGLRQTALQMSLQLRHRGPDWSGIYCGGSAILAHERLSIVDPVASLFDRQTQDSGCQWRDL